MLVSLTQWTGRPVVFLHIAFVHPQLTGSQYRDGLCQPGPVQVGQSVHVSQHDTEETQSNLECSPRSVCGKGARETPESLPTPLEASSG